MPESPSNLRTPPRSSRRLSPRLAVKAGGRIIFIDPGNILSVQAEGNYVSLHCETTAYSVRESITRIAETLAEFGFVRIHRSVLVNILFVEQVYPRSTGEYVLHLKSGKQYTVTRTYRKNLSALADLWVGIGELGAILGEPRSGERHLQ
jgi:DNA-binding LytR/AlgR family response regulator